MYWRRVVYDHVPRYYENLSALNENTNAVPPEPVGIPWSSKEFWLTWWNTEKSLINAVIEWVWYDSAGYDVQPAYKHPVIRFRLIRQLYVPQDIPCGAYVHTFDYRQR